MKAIVECFRELAAEDRHFGAEPATADAPMRPQIDKHAFKRRVDAKLHDRGANLTATEGQASMPPGISMPAADDAAHAVQDASQVPTPPVTAPWVGTHADTTTDTAAARLSKLRVAQMQPAVSMMQPFADFTSRFDDAQVYAEDHDTQVSRPAPMAEPVAEPVAISATAATVASPNSVAVASAAEASVAGASAAAAPAVAEPEPSSSLIPAKRDRIKNRRDRAAQRQAAAQAAAPAPAAIVAPLPQHPTARLDTLLATAQPLSAQTDDLPIASAELQTIPESIAEVAEDESDSMLAALYVKMTAMSVQDDQLAADIAAATDSALIEPALIDTDLSSAALPQGDGPAIDLSAIADQFGHQDWDIVAPEDSLSGEADLDADDLSDLAALDFGPDFPHDAPAALDLTSDATNADWTDTDWTDTAPPARQDLGSSATSQEESADLPVGASSAAIADAPIATE
ncbi:MAG: hypothetical protein WCS20_15290, partial [Alphaproteobacteria bacterium]